MHKNMYFVDVFFDVFLGRSFGDFWLHFAFLWEPFWALLASFGMFLLELQKTGLPMSFLAVLGGLLVTADPRRTRFYPRNT